MSESQMTGDNRAIPNANPQFEGDLVAWRLAHGSYCRICPLQHMRKVGCDGNIDSDVILTGEAPGKDETNYNRGRQPHGTPFVGKSGWAMKAYLLGPAGLATVAFKRGSKWPKVTKVIPFITNVAMCQPPKSKADSPQGRRALLCCADSYIAMLKELDRRKERMHIQMGASALWAVTGKTKIGQHRGRFKQIDVQQLKQRGFEAVAKDVLRGVKPPPEFAEHLKVIRAFVNAGRAAWRKACKPPTAPKAPKVSKPRKKKEKPCLDPTTK